MTTNIDRAQLATLAQSRRAVVLDDAAIEAVALDVARRYARRIGYASEALRDDVRASLRQLRSDTHGGDDE